MFYIKQLDLMGSDKIISTLKTEKEFVPKIKSRLAGLTNMIALENVSEVNANFYIPGLYLLINVNQITLVHKINQVNILTLFVWQILPSVDNISEEPLITLYSNVQIIKSLGSTTTLNWDYTITNANDGSTSFLSSDYINLVLTDLWTMAKGNDIVKGYIGTILSPELIYFLYNIHLRTHAAILLRSITVNNNNKILFNRYCQDIIDVLKMNPSEISETLTAVVWNLSSIKINRVIFTQKKNLDIIAKLLSQSEKLKQLKLQGELIGAIRNLTLDPESIKLFAETNIIHTLMLILPTASPSHIKPALNIIRNLSVDRITHGQIVNTGTEIKMLMLLISDCDDTNRYIGDIFNNLLSNEDTIGQLLNQDLPPIFSELMLKMNFIDEFNTRVSLMDKFVELVKKD